MARAATPMEWASTTPSARAARPADSGHRRPSEVGRDPLDGQFGSGVPFDLDVVALRQPGDGLVDVGVVERGVEHDGVDVGSQIDAAVDLHLDVVVQIPTGRADGRWVVEELEQSALVDRSPEE